MENLNPIFVSYTRKLIERFPNRKIYLWRSDKDNYYLEYRDQKLLYKIDHCPTNGTGWNPDTSRNDAEAEWHRYLKGKI